MADRSHRGEARAIAAVRFVRPGVHIDGSITSQLQSAGDGEHRGWSFAEDAAGVVATKGRSARRFPWSALEQVEYVDG